MRPSTLGPTFVRTCGRPDAPPLVLLPGIGSSSLMWMGNVAGLAEGFWVHAVDNVYDAGRSVWQRAPTSGADYAAWLASLLDALQLDRPHLLGASYGGWIAAQFALAHPDRLDGLVLFAPAGTVVPLRAAFLVRAACCAVPLRIFPRRLLRWLAADTLSQGPRGEAQVNDAVQDGIMALRCFRRRAVVPPTVLADADLAALPDRTWFLVGDREVVFDPAAALHRLATVAPQIHTRVVPGTGHDLPLARPEVFNRHVLAALA